MKRIALLSDTHGYLPDNIFKFFDSCDEIWHAGDIGTINIYDKLNAIKPTKAVYGNIDGSEIRKACPEHLRFYCEKVDVWMTHIGGYPPNRFAKNVRPQIYKNPPRLFICGHSHILKVMPYKKLDMLHINPGAAGKYGFHKVKTMVRFTIDKDNIKDLEVIELGKRI